MNMKTRNWLYVVPQYKKCNRGLLKKLDHNWNKTYKLFGVYNRSKIDGLSYNDFTDEKTYLSNIKKLDLYYQIPYMLYISHSYKNKVLNCSFKLIPFRPESDGYLKTLSGMTPGAGFALLNAKYELDRELKGLALKYELGTHARGLSEFYEILSKFLDRRGIRLNAYKAEVDSLDGLYINTYKDYLGVELREDPKGRKGQLMHRFRHDLINPIKTVPEIRDKYLAGELDYARVRAKSIVRKPRG